MSNNQLTLPYFEIEKIANRDYLRKNFTVSGRVAYKIPFGKIEERDNFNKRKVYEDIEELAQSILINGLKEPFVLDILPDGRAIVEQGHRRKRAIQLLIDRKEIYWNSKTEVEFFPNKSEVTEMHRIINQLTSNNLKKKLKPFEAAEVAHDIKYNFSVKPKSNEEVAELMGISRQMVDYYILISAADDLLKNEMLTADMNLTECVALVKNKKKVEKQADKAEEDSHKSSAAATPPPKDELAGDIKDMEKLQEPTPEELEEQAEQDLEELLKVSDQIKVRAETIRQHMDRKLSADVIKDWVHDFTNAQGEPESKDMSTTIISKGVVISEDVVSLLLDTEGIDTIFVYKKGMEPVAASVITEPVAEKEKDKYDSDRPEIAQIQNIIKLADKIEAVVNKLDCPDQTKLDLGNYVKWLQKDAAEVREWIHKNKKQNKMR